MPIAALVVPAVLLCVAGAQQEAEGPSFSLGGLAFGDLYGVPEHHTAGGEGSAGAVLRRGYLTADARLDPRWSARVRLEANQAGEFETYDYTVDFKDLYVRRQVRRQSLTFGLSPPPTFDLIEGVWALRYLMRTPMDLQGIASRDTGLAANGPLNASGSFAYRAMVGAGLQFGDDSGDGLKWMGALTWKAPSAWVVDVYADYEFLQGEADRTTLQGFVGFDTEDLRWGLQYSHQNRQSDPGLELASAFLVVRAGDDASVVLRVDRLFQPSPKGDNISYIPFDPSAPATMLLGGAEFRAHSLLTVTPNAVIIVYDADDQGVRPGTDLHLRLTLFFDLE